MERKKQLQMRTFSIILELKLEDGVYIPPEAHVAGD